MKRFDDIIRNSSRLPISAHRLRDILGKLSELECLNAAVKFSCIHQIPDIIQYHRGIFRLSAVSRRGGRGDRKAPRGSLYRNAGLVPPPPPPPRR